MQTRIRVSITVKATAVAFVLLGLAGSPAGAADVAPDVQPVSSEVVVRSFWAGDYRVTMSAESWRWVSLHGPSGWVCVSAVRSEVSGDTRTFVGQYGCLDRPVRYRFDPLEWRAAVSGAGRTWVTRETQRYRDGEWQHESFEILEPSAAVHLDVAFTGVGEVDRKASVHGPGITYGIPPVAFWAQIVSSRAAVVRGSIRFDGLGLDAAIPRDHPGSMTWR